MSAKFEQNWSMFPATFEVGGASARVGGEIDYSCIGPVNRIYEIMKKYGAQME